VGARGVATAEVEGEARVKQMAEGKEGLAVAMVAGEAPAAPVACAEVQAVARAAAARGALAGRWAEEAMAEQPGGSKAEAEMAQDSGAEALEGMEAADCTEPSRQQKEGCAHPQMASFRCTSHGKQSPSSHYWGE